MEGRFSELDKPGSRVSVTVKNGGSFEATVIAFDRGYGLATFQDGKPDSPNVRILHISTVKSVKLLEEAPNTTEQPIPAFDEELVVARQQQAYAKMLEESKMIGQNVSAEAQELFDAIAKTHPCAWSGRSIIVLDEVKVDPPYTPNCCKPLRQDAAAACIRVQRVVEGERRKLGIE